MESLHVKIPSELKDYIKVNNINASKLLRESIINFRMGNDSQDVYFDKLVNSFIRKHYLNINKLKSQLHPDTYYEYIEKVIVKERFTESFPNKAHCYRLAEIVFYLMYTQQDKDVVIKEDFLGLYEKLIGARLGNVP